MSRRLTSLRFWLLAAMLVAAALGIVGAYLVFGRLESAQQHRADLDKARRTASAVAAQAAAGARARRFRGLQEVLPNDQLIVVRDGATLFRGPPVVGRDLELTVTVPFRNGSVTIRDYESRGPAQLLDFLLVAGGAMLLVVLAAWVVATVVTRAVRGPVERAVEAADRIARGDRGARMGASGPDELVRLGRAFDSMASRLEAADVEQRRFLADVAHEIATPTNAISGYGLALADGTLATDAEREEARQLIEHETRRLNDLIAALRELTRLDLAAEPRVTAVDLAEIAAGAVARFRPAARDAGVELRADAKEVVVATDPRLVDTVVDNLLSNAIRYTPRGGRVVLEVRRRRGDVSLSVRDTGIGIAAEERDRIFDRLYRIDDTRDRARGGSGLGLPIARRAALALGGRIEVTSEPGRGSEFRLVLPAGARRRPGRTATPSR